MKRFLLRKRVLLAILVAVIGVGIYVAAMPKADALFGPGVCTYYSDAKYKTVVGARGTGCCGEVINWGVTTKYVKCQVLYCLDVLCPN